MWAIQVAPGKTGAFDRVGLRKLRASGINAVSLNVQSLGRSPQALRTFESVLAFTRASKMLLVPVVPAGRAWTSPLLWHALAGCQAHKAGLRCAVQAPSVAAARNMARVGDSVRPLVALYVSGPRAITSLLSLRSVKRRVLVIVPLYKSLNAEAWATAIEQAAGSSSIDVGVAPQAGLASVSARQLGALLGGTKAVAQTAPSASPPDVTPPSAPVMTLDSVTPFTVTVSWQPSTDDVGVSSYALYVDGKVIQANAASPASVSALTCGITVSIGLDAVDAAGNRSPISSLGAMPKPCGGGGGGSNAPVVADTIPPSTPAGLATSGVSPTAITLSWTVSSDNVAVTGYKVYLDRNQAATVTGTSYTFAGLACATTHSLSVAAYDAAGNVSPQAVPINRQTLACGGDTTPPSTPSGLSVSGTGQSSVSLSWSGSSDNVGVTGYRMLVGGSQVGTALSTSYVFGGLTCGTSYSFGVAGVDAAGNVSAVASVGVQTAACPVGGTGSVFVSQAGGGLADGSSCANARPVSFFNTASNWGAGKPIAPGVTVGLCGTISSTLTVQGSGTSGSPVTVQFQSGAKLEQPVCGDCLVMDNRSWIVIDGNNTGQIDSSDNGTSKGHHQTSTAISADPCTNCEIKNLVVGPIYTIASGDSSICSSGCAVDNAGAKCIRFSGANWKIDGNTMHDASWCLYEYGNGSDGNVQIYANNIYNIDHGWTITGGGPYGHLYFHDNHMHDMGGWDACAAGGNNCHHDGIHCFFGPGAGAHFADSYIYNNRFDGTLGSSATAWIYLESNSSSPCSDSTSKWYLFNNVFSSSDQVSTNPYVTVESNAVPNNAYQYNNTFAGPGAGHYGANLSACTNSRLVFENNAVGGCNKLAGISTTAGSTADYNAYANGVSNSSGDNCWNVGGCSFPSWQSTGKDTHGVYNQAAAVGSNTTGVGTNLTSLCSGDLTPLCSDINGNPRPTTGPWNAGATG